MIRARQDVRINRWRRLLEVLRSRLSVWAPMLLMLLPGQRAAAATLPEQRSDLLYHLYDGGGQTVQGPALLLRKNIAEKLSLFGGYYVDEISGASIDVITNASPYHEERREITAGGDYLYRDTLMSFSYTDSNEHDYKARTYNVAVAQDMFNNRTTFTLGYFQGDDIVGDVDNPTLHAKADRDGYSVALAQVINPTLIGTLSYEGTVDDGYLENPYRYARVAGAFVLQSYPGTHSGQALSQKFVKSWSSRWSTYLEGRYYQDSWSVHAFDVSIGASEYLFHDWLVDESFRHYQQQAASFYSNNFAEAQSFMTRDKELAHFSSNTIGTKLTVPLYRGDQGNHAIVNSVSMSVAFDYMLIDYKDFTDVRDGQLYGFNATIAQVFFTVRY